MTQTPCHVSFVPPFMMAVMCTWYRPAGGVSRPITTFSRCVADENFATVVLLVLALAGVVYVVRSRRGRARHHTTVKSNDVTTLGPAYSDKAVAEHEMVTVTNPINKAALYDAGFSYPGHTEFLAALTGVPGKEVMMLASPMLRVVPVTIHQSLRSALDSLTPAMIATAARTTAAALRRDFGIPSPRLAIAGLNPHAGEQGALGTEESTLVAPAIEALRREGIDASGPHPADTVFHQAVHRGRYDAIVCMYHDQGHGPMKLLAFDSGVNVTIGLPIVRTSVDHGTAFDIAWKGVAFTDSLVHALGFARLLVGD